MANISCSVPDTDYTSQRMIIGTHTSGQANDHLIIAEVLLPKKGAEISDKALADLYDEEKQGHTHSSSTI